MRDDGVEELLVYLRESLGPNASVLVKAEPPSNIVNDSAVETVSAVLSSAASAIFLIDRGIAEYRKLRKGKLRVRVVLLAEDGRTPLRTIDEDRD